MRCCVFGIVLLVACADSDKQVVAVPSGAPVIVAQVAVPHPAPPRPALPVEDADDSEPDVDDAGDGIPDEDDDTDKVYGEKPGFTESVVLAHDPTLEVVVRRGDTDDERVVDHDIDMIVDIQDRCPDSPEDNDGFEDIDGCPEPAGAALDRDHDEVTDAVDRCPDSPEDIDGWEDNDGCPDADHDIDAIIDVEDQTAVL